MSYFAYEPEFITDDPGFLRLPAEAGYIYMMLVNRMLRHGPLSPDKEFYRLLWGSRCRRFSLAWDQATSVIDRDSDGFMVCSWAIDARLEADAALKSDRSRKQKARSEARERNVSAGLPPDVQGKSTGCPPLTVGRSVGRTVEKIVEHPEDQPRVTVSKPRKEPSGDHAQFIAWWCETFEKATGARYNVQGAKDGANVKLLLQRAGGDLEALRSRALILLYSAPAWIAEGGKDLGTLVLHWNKLVSQGTGIASGAKLAAVAYASKQPVPSSGLLDMPTKPPQRVNGAHP